MAERYDFGGYATKNDLKCADGRTIRRNAFKECDGITVPLVWQHEHDDPSKVLGHALLENRDDGVYAYCKFNNTKAGQTAKELVMHKDIKSMSIYANKLIQKASDVVHGVIREVSLVMAGANPGALIRDLSFEHFDDEDSEFEAWIYNDENIVLAHSAIPAAAPIPAPVQMPQYAPGYIPAAAPIPYQMPPANYLAHATATAPAPQKEKTMEDVMNSMNEDQKNLMFYCVQEALKQGAQENETQPEDANKEEEDMSHNLFENQGTNNSVLIHDALQTVLEDAKKYGSLKESYEHHLNEGVLAHIDTTGMETSTGNQTYFVNDPSFLFPEAKSLNNPPEWIQRDMDWVQEVIGKTHHTPYSRIKSVFADITADEARAKGYAKGKDKIEEVFTLLKRTTTPQTVYKKQKMDRDDMLDITDFDVVAWIKSEMRIMLNEEIARAILIGDGRNPMSDYKISEDHVRPIATDKPLFTIQQTVTVGASEEATAKNFMKACLRARKDYKGSGNPTLFTTEEVLTSMLLIEDGIGHMMYRTEAELATALRVKKIVTVPVMEGMKLDSNANELMGIIVNLADYNVGADKGGEINMFDDFDIDVNQQKYLIETRISGALIKPYSAIVLKKPVSGT